MAIAFVRENTAGSGTTSPVAVTTAATPSGHTLIAFISSNRGSSAARTVSSITQTNVTWAKIPSASGANVSLGVEIWIGTNVTGSASGTSASVAFSGTIASGACVDILEFSGVLVGTANDGSGVSNTGTSTAPAAGAFSSTQANDVILACVGYENTTGPTGSPSSPWANGTFKGQTTCGLKAAYKLAAPTGSQTGASWTIGATGDVWCTVICALKVSPQTSTLTASMATMAGSAVKRTQMPLLGPGISFVQSAGTVQSTTGTTLSVAYPSPCTAGNMLVAVVAAVSTGATLSVADTLTSTWLTAELFDDVTDGDQMRVFYVPSCSGGANTVTFTISPTKTFRELAILEYNGFGGLVAINQVRNNNGTATTATTSSITTTNANAVILAWITTSGTVTTPNNGFTTRENASVGGNAVGDLITTSVGTYTPSFNLSGSALFIMQAVAFELSAVSGLTFAGDFSGSKLSAHLQSLAASMATMSGTTVKLTTDILTASMATMAATLRRGRLLAASMATMSATLVYRMVKVLTASLATFSATLNRGKSFTASLSTMAGTIVKLTKKVFGAS